MESDSEELSLSDVVAGEIEGGGRRRSDVEMVDGVLASASEGDFPGDELSFSDEYSLSYSDEDGEDFFMDEDDEDDVEDVLWEASVDDVSQQIFSLKEPTPEQREELWAYIQVLRQFDSVEEDSYPRNPR